MRSGASAGEYAAAMLPFCAVTPVGALVGMSIKDDGDGVATAAVLALAGGTFVYIGLMEIIAKELPGHDGDGADKLPKILLILAGWGFMAMLALWV